MDKRIVIKRGWDAVNRIDIEKNFNATYMIINKDLRSLKIAICKNEMFIFYKNALIHKIDIINHKDVDFRGTWDFTEIIDTLEGQLYCLHDSVKKEKRIQFKNYIEFLREKSGIDFKINYTTIRVFYDYFYNQTVLHDTDNTIYSYRYTYSCMTRLLNTTDILSNKNLTDKCYLIECGKNKGLLKNHLNNSSKKYLVGGING